MEEPVRLRLVFEDRHVLSKSQRSEGLRRCLLLLKPELRTISDLASHIVHCFALERSCPNGILLSWDGFVLPSFESTCIFKDTDIIRVGKRGCSLKQVIKIGDDANHIEDTEIVEKQPLVSSDKLLAIKEFEEESGGYKSEDEVDAHDLPENAILTESPSNNDTTSKRKRKHSDKLLSSKSKKVKLSNPEKSPKITSEEIVQNESCSKKRGISRKSLRRKENGSGGLDTIITSQVDGGIKNTAGSVHIEEKHDQVQENCQTDVCEPCENGSMTKLPSRSARRKKSKRQWKRELKNSQNKLLPFYEKHIPANDISRTSPQHQKRDADKVDEIIPIEHIQIQLPANDISRTSPQHQKLDADKEDAIVPFEVRPGHIRFEPIEQSKQQSHGLVETLHWNGTTNKKKGQKWGREKTLCRRNDGNVCNEEPNQKDNEKDIAEEGELVGDHIDFERLMPLTCLPKESDVVAYRLVELSSWCPELSPFRVGKVSSYDSVSMKVILVPVPGYPIVPGEKRDEESTIQPNVSPYKEDGSLEIDFPSLVDVRIFNNNKSEPRAGITDLRDKAEKSAPVNNWEVALADPNSKYTMTPPTENRPDGGWHQINQALDEKKAQLNKKNGWTSWPKKDNPTNTSWSYRAMRGSALGPTISLLRAKNNL